MGSVRRTDRKVTVWLRYCNRYPLTCRTLSTAFDKAEWRQTRAWAHRIREGRSAEERRADKLLQRWQRNWEVMR